MLKALEKIKSYDRILKDSNMRCVGGQGKTKLDTRQPNEKKPVKREW